ALATPPGAGYSGALPVPGGFMVDYNSHMAKMWQGARGDFAYRLLFTHEAHPGLPGVQGFYVLAGAVAQAAGLSFPVMYHLLRLLCTVLMMLALWQVAGRCVGPGPARWTALLLATTVMGWGWLLYFVAPWLPGPPAPIEFWLIDAYNLSGALYMPHFSAAISLQCAGALLLDAWLRRPRAALLLWLTLALLLQVWLQPYAVLLTLPLFGLVTLWALREGLPLRRALPLLLPAGAMAAGALAQALLLRSHPVWVAFTDQNITASPAPVYYLAGYAPFLVALLMGAGRPARPASPPDTFWRLLLLWALLVALLVYAPVPAQRRYLLGVQTPLAMLAAAGWQRGISRLAPRLRPLLAIPFFALSALAGLLLLAGNIGGVLAPAAPVYDSADALAGYAWLRQHTPPDALILTTLDGEGRGSGGRLVAMTGRRVFVGHWIETADFAAKVGQVARFYQPAAPAAWRHDFLTTTGIAFIWYDESARAFGDWSPATDAALTAVFTTPTVQLYRVDLP
ncbi:MAG: hypothetical protein MUE40_21130, partial [Anaerolineae bacterium]|nr:hypothetical protein [Anaerolineae bacterium]